MLSKAKVATVATQKQVATVIVRNGNKILMGKRNDNGRYTNPGGHMEEGEDPREAAVRELKEEAGIEVEPEDLKHLASKDVVTFTGKKMKIHAYLVDSKQKPSSKNDPDEEVNKWEWIDVEDGLADEIKANLHSPKNVALKELGLIKAMMKAEKLSGGIADGKKKKDFDQKQLESGKKVEREHTSDEKVAEEIAMDHLAEDSNYYKKLKKIEKSKFFILDLIKSSGGAHKYIRKYQRGGKWIYIYHEGQQHGRRLDPQAFEAMKRLAEAGHEHSRNLMDSIQEHPQAKLDALRRLADSGHAPSKEHLRSLGIDREQEKLEENLVPRAVKPKDEMDKDLTAQEKAKMVAALKKEIADSAAHLSRYTGEEIGRKVHPVISNAALTEKIDRATTLREGLNALGEIAHKLEQAQGTTSASRPGDDKTYGNLVYNKGLQALKEANLIPQDYHDEHKRTARTGVPEHKDMKGVRERAERRRAEEAERQRREQAEREERERRELAEVHGSMAHHMATLAGGSLSTTEIKRLHSTLSAMFGKNMRKEDWPYDFSEHGYTVKISSLRFSNGGVSMDFKVKDRNGNDVVRTWSREWRKDGRTFEIYNSYLAVNSSARGSDKPIGSLINQSQIKFIKSHAPTNGQIAVTAALDVGGYNWANQGFSFKSEMQMREYQQRFKSYLSRHGINLTPQEVSQFTLPCHFASFDTGKKIVRDVGNPIGLSSRQRESGTLSGKPGGTPLTPQEIREGKTSRIECHLGKDFLLGNSWSGILKASDMNDSNEAFRYFNNYETMRNGAWRLFNEPVKRIFEAKQGHTVPSSATPISSTPPTGPPSTRPARVVRPRRFSSWNAERQQRWFDENSGRMSRAARIAARRIISDTRSRESSATSGSV